MSNDPIKYGSNAYRKAYNAGNLTTYVKSKDLYVGKDLETASAVGEAPVWLKAQKEYDRKYPKPAAPTQGPNKAFGFKSGRQNEWETNRDKYVAKAIEKANPILKDKNKSRGDRLNSLSDLDQEYLLKGNPKYNTSLWQDASRGAGAIAEAAMGQSLPILINPENYSKKEIAEKVNAAAQSPKLNKIGEMSGILAPLTVPAKMVQSAYKGDYSIGDAARGSKNDASIVEDIVTDPFTYTPFVGGAWRNSARGFQATQKAALTASKPTHAAIATAIENTGKENVLANVPKKWQLEELPGLHLESTMSNGKVTNIVEKKTGLVNIEQAFKIIEKEKGGKEKLELIKKVFGDDLPQKMDYNEFRKKIQSELIPLEIKANPAGNADYGSNRIGYNSNNYSYNKLLKNEVDKIEELTALRNESNAEDIDILIKQSVVKIKGYQKAQKEGFEILESNSVTFSNKNKFGIGSDAHHNPIETLGHSLTVRTKESPNVLTVTQRQSDAFQGTHRTMTKDFSKSNDKLKELERKISDFNREADLAKKNIELEKAKVDLDPSRLEYHEGTLKLWNKETNNAIKKLEEYQKLNDISLSDFNQKKLLDKDHESRFLQELVSYASKRDGVDKIRLPTKETAASIQGYNPSGNSFKMLDEIKKDPKGFAEYLNDDLSITPSDRKKVNDVLDGKIKGNIYDAGDETILKKYETQPKLVKKIFGKDTQVVSDGIGNTWYEFDIPESFKLGKGEIKAFSIATPLLGAYMYGASNSNEL